MIVVPFELISIDGDGYHLLVDAALNGRPARMLVDTGASRTVFDRERIQQFIPDGVFLPAEKTSTGLGTDSMEGHTTTVETFQVGDLVLESVEVVVLDLAHVNSSYGLIGLDAIDGVLGSDMLVKHNAVIDYGKKELVLTDR